MEKSQESKKDISFTLDVRKIPLNGLSLSFAASDDQKQKLALLFDVPKIHTFDATAHLQQKGRLIELTGSFSSKITQLSVVSLESFKNTVSGDFLLLFSTHKEDATDSPDIDLDEEPVEFLPRPILDFYPIFTEQFGLYLDSFPRKEGESFEYRETSEKSEKQNPFSVLKGLTKGKKSV